MPGGTSFVSRNAIRDTDGRLWLTVPVSGKGEFRPISEIRTARKKWGRKHINSLKINYSRSQWKNIIEEFIEPIISSDIEKLADINIELIKVICEILEITPNRFLRASEMALAYNDANSVPEILRRTSATSYLTGMGEGMRRYLESWKLDSLGVKTVFVSPAFRRYKQLHRGFEENLSAIDALLSVGPEETSKILRDPPLIVSP